MHPYNMCQKLKLKIEELVEILPKEFQMKFKENCFVAGGCIFSMINDRNVNDYDFFLEDSELANDMYEYFSIFTNKCTAVGRNDISMGTYKGFKLLVSKYAITIGKQFQIIIKYSGTPEKVLEQFDFKHNMFAYKYSSSEFIRLTDMKYLTDMKLRFNDIRSRDICGTIMRIPKFKDKGFSISKKEIAKMLKKLMENGFTQAEIEIINEHETY